MSDVDLFSAWNTSLNTLTRNNVTSEAEILETAEVRHPLNTDVYLIDLSARLITGLENRNRIP